jgi:3'-phosphoadenosine 5'-phosphosulfate (PAPS) 3'-phosphatase
MEWDTAAGHAIVELAGGSVHNQETDQPLRYNKENLLNPWFIVRALSRAEKRFSKSICHKALRKLMN